MRDRGRVLLRLPAPAHVRAGIFVVLGREVRRLADASYNDGPQSFALPPDLAPGVYLVRATLGDVRLSKKFVALD